MCFNNNVSNLYNNSVVEKIYGMAYIFTLLMFRKSNKTIINKILIVSFVKKILTICLKKQYTRYDQSISDLE
jgi:hypothetical protein